MWCATACWRRRAECSVAKAAGWVGAKGDRSPLPGGWGAIGCSGAGDYREGGCQGVHRWEGDRSFRLAPAVVEPSLQEDGSRCAIDEEPPFFRRHASFAQPASRFDRGEPFVHQLDVPPRGIGKRLGKAPRSPGFAPLGSAAVEGQPYQKSLDVLLASDTAELRQEPPLAIAREWRTWMSHCPELIRNRQADPNPAQIDRRDAHAPPKPLAQPSRTPEAARRPENPSPSAEPKRVDPAPAARHKRARR
jgi:hypothetical protein